ncbi:hypothetical protein GUK36_29870 [Rhizobium leguminosarum]|uniref:Uncharacterized protein n=2 Tax=Rhizobium TaxID=379 RepID=A0A6P0DNJ4_RHILE|nr:hypothetical protein [Rhizobium leguminosarum]MDH6276618.1 hypothetical protein [Rhizobium leguminosarum]NEK53613.1 hypothetical protein [Rhizobium leguminosarum]
MKYIRSRMIEFRDRMDPLLKELNLRARTQTNEHGVEVYFVARDRKRDPLMSHSSVSILFEDRDSTGLPEAAWTNACLQIEQHEPRALGNTGWAHRRWWESIPVFLPTDPDEMWSLIEKNFREQPFITMEERPMEVESYELADAFFAAERSVEGLDVEREVTELGSIESLVFHDDSGRDVRLEFPAHGFGRVFVGGEQVGEFDQYHEERIASMARALQRCNDYATTFLRK